jgi:hypothetical protein
MRHLRVPSQAAASRSIERLNSEKSTSTPGEQFYPTKKPTERDVCNEGKDNKSKCLVVTWHYLVALHADAREYVFYSFFDIVISIEERHVAKGRRRVETRRLSASCTV